MEINGSLDFTGSLFKGATNVTQRLKLSDTYQWGLDLTRGYIGGGYISNAGWTVVTTIQNRTDTWGTSPHATLSRPFRYGGYASFITKGFFFYADWSYLSNDVMQFSTESVSAIANRNYGTLNSWIQEGVGYDSTGAVYGTKAYSLANGSTNYDILDSVTETFSTGSSGSIYTGDQTYCMTWFDKRFGWNLANDGVTRKFTFSTQTWAAISPSPNYTFGLSYWGKGLPTKVGVAYVHPGGLVKPFMKYMTTSDSYITNQYSQTLDNDEQSPVMGQSHGYWAGGYNGVQNAHSDRVDYTTDAVRKIYDAPRALSAGNPLWSGYTTPNLISNSAASSTSGYAANGNVGIGTETINGVQYVYGEAAQNTSTPGIWPIGGTVNAVAGERYRVSVRGYTTGSPAWLYVWGNSTGDIVWQGTQLATTRQWVSNEFTVPSGNTQLRVGVLWSNPVIGSRIYIDEFKLEPLIDNFGAGNAGQVEADKLSIPSGVPQTGLLLALTSDAYSSGSNVWFDRSGQLNNARVSSGAFVDSSQGFNTNGGGAIELMGDPEMYSADFTWIMWHQYLSGGSSLYGLWWSESGVKNFLVGYGNTGNGQVNPYLRIDTPTNQYYSTSSGTNYNGFSSNTSTLPCKWVMTTLKKSGNTFSLYWNNAQLMWQGSIGDWFSPTMIRNAQNTMIGSNNSGGYPSNMRVPALFMYGRAISDGEIQSVYSATQKTGTLCALPNGSLSVTGSACNAVTPSATFNANAGTGPFVLTINGSNYTVNSGVAFNLPYITGTTTWTISSIVDRDGLTRTSGITGPSATTTIFYTPNVTVNPSSATIVQGNSVTLTASGASSYSWSTGATSASITVSPSSTTTYTVTGYAANGGCPASVNVTVTVTANTLPYSFTIKVPFSAYDCYEACWLWFCEITVWSYSSSPPNTAGQVLYTDAQGSTQLYSGVFSYAGECFQYSGGPGGVCDVCGC